MDWAYIFIFLIIALIMGCFLFRSFWAKFNIPTSEEIKQYPDIIKGRVQTRIVKAFIKHVPEPATTNIINELITKIPLSEEEVKVKCSYPPLPDDLKAMLEVRQNDTLPWDSDVSECSATGLPFDEISMYTNVYDTMPAVTIY